jgi:hypothetical protein
MVATGEDVVRGIVRPTVEGSFRNPPERPPLFTRNVLAAARESEGRRRSSTSRRGSWCSEGLPEKPDLVPSALSVRPVEVVDWRKGHG